MRIVNGKQPDDFEIIEALKRDNIDSPVSMLYQEYYAGIEEFVTFRGGMPEDAADLFQEALLILVEKVRSGKFRGESGLKTFLYGIVRNLWLMELRTRDRRKKREEFFTDNEPLVEDPGFGKRASTNIQALFDQIGPVCKSILLGFYYENKPMKVLLEEFDFKTEQVLRNKKASCMKKLKELILSNENLITSLKSDYVYE